jgi:hypothetical protein
MARIPYRLARGGERRRRAGNVLYFERRAVEPGGYSGLRVVRNNATALNEL